MKFAIIGLGRMGHNLTLQALEKGLDIVAYNRTAKKVKDLGVQVQNSRPTERRKTKFKIKNSGRFIAAYTIEEVIKNLAPARVIILMVPAGNSVDQVISQLFDAGLSKGDIVIDGGNSNYKDSVRRYKELKKKGVHFLDMGTSGGIEGARNGACLMIGGDQDIYNKVEPIFKALSTKNGYGYVGPSGAGHFVKVVHNGIEYGMLQAIGESFEVLEKGPYELDFVEVSKIYSHGSVIRGWLLDLLYDFFKKDPKLDSLEGVIGGGKTGQWTQEYAKDERVKTPVLDAAMKARVESQKKPTFAGKVIAALRNQFGGHAIKKKT